jgi:MFS family permease
MIRKDRMFFKFSLYGFLKNLRFFEPFILLFFRDAALSFFQIGLLFSIRDLATNIFEIPTGVYADAFGRRRSMVMAFVAYILSFIMFFFLPNFYVYALAMLLFAGGEAFRTGTHKALILEYLKLNDMTHLKVEYYGRTRAASQLGSALNALIAAALVFYSGNYRYVFVASILPYVIDLINLATYPKELDGELVRARTGAHEGAIGAQLRETLGTFLGVFRHPPALRAILNSSGFDSFFKATKEYLQPILEAFAIALPVLVALENTRRSAVIIGVVYFCIYLLTSYASRSAAQFGRRFAGVAQGLNWTFLAGAVLLFGAGIAAQRQWDVLAILIFLGFYLLHNVRRPMTVAYVSDQISSRVMAAGLSAESQFTTVGAALLAPVLGALADWLGVGVALACLGGGMLVLALLFRLQATEHAELERSGLTPTGDGYDHTKTRERHIG